MAERKRSEMDVLNGGAFNPNNYLGGFIPGLLGRQMIARGEQSGGDHATAWVDMVDSWFRLLGGVPSAYVFKDTTDGELQFSVAADRFVLRGMDCQFAGAVNQGNLTRSVANYIYLVLTSAPTIAVGFSTLGWPGQGGNAYVPHRRLAVITPPGAGHWTDDHLVRLNKLDATFPPGLGWIAMPFAYNTGSPLALGRVVNGGYICRATIFIATVFNGTAPTLQVGYGGLANWVMATGDSNAKLAGTYIVTGWKQASADRDLQLTITPDGSSTGAGMLLIETFTL